jgi:hypothetical protein
MMGISYAVPNERAARCVRQTLLEAYRLQYILSGARHPHFASALATLTTDAQLEHTTMPSFLSLRCGC